MQRLQNKQPTYSVEKWDQDYRLNEKFRENLIEYPYEFGKQNSRARFMLTTAHEELEDGQLPHVQSATQMSPNGSHPNMNRQPYQSLSSVPSQARQSRGGSAKPGLPSAVIRQAENLDENRIVLYKRSKQLGQGYFIVEISSNNSHLFIAAYDVESPESLLIELPERRAQDILREFQSDYEHMANSLQVMNKRLVLLNPVSVLLLTFGRNLCSRNKGQALRLRIAPTCPMYRLLETCSCARTRQVRRRTSPWTCDYVNCEMASLTKV